MRDKSSGGQEKRHSLEESHFPGTPATAQQNVTPPLSTDARSSVPPPEHETLSSSVAPPHKLSYSQEGTVDNHDLSRADEIKTTELSGDQGQSFFSADKPASLNVGGLDQTRAVTTTSFSLLEMLKHKSETMRLKALDSLLKIADATLVYAFVNCMRDESYQVRLKSLRGLYKFGGNQAVEHLIAALEDVHPDVRRRAIIYLGWLKRRDVVPYILDALADPSPVVRKVATYTLGDLKDGSAVPHLLKALDDPDPDVRKGAHSALKRITRQPIEPLPGSAGDITQETIERWKEWWKTQSSKLHD